MSIPSELADMGMVEDVPGLAEWVAKKDLHPDLELCVFWVDEVVVELTSEHECGACEVKRYKTLTQALPCIKALLALPL